jgi:hypothetical protein
LIATMRFACVPWFAVLVACAARPTPVEPRRTPMPLLEASPCLTVVDSSTCVPFTADDLELIRVALVDRISPEVRTQRFSSTGAATVPLCPALLEPSRDWKSDKFRLRVDRHAEPPGHLVFGLECRDPPYPGAAYSLKRTPDGWTVLDTAPIAKVHVL